MKIISRKEAKALGLKRYFNGKPCPCGHLAERQVSDSHCFECRRIYKSSWRANNRGKENERTRAWRRNNPQKALESSRAGHEKNRERDRELCRAWRKANPDKVSHNNREWVKLNPEKKRARDHNRRARKKGSGGSHTAFDIVDLYRLQGGRCACGCNEPLKKKYHVDHIVPLSRGGGNNRQNLQLLRPKCNRNKWHKDPIVFAQENGRLL